MESIVHLEFLVEDVSGKIMLEKIMEKYSFANQEYNLTYKINGFKGIGHLPRKNTKILNLKTKKLLNDLPHYLSGLSKSLKNSPYKNAIIVVLDSDDKDCKNFKKELLNMASTLNLQVETFFCIAIEEMEAWLLGDSNAVISAFPNSKMQLLQNYAPDSIVGTWEYLANVTYEGGVNKLKKNSTSYYEIGAQKCEWARKIGENLQIDTNISPSFNYLISKLDLICNSK